MQKNKKISFLSGIFIVIGGTIGSGIFFKNSEILFVNNNSLFFSIFSWLLAIVGILLLIISLVNISKEKNLGGFGLLKWNKLMNSNYIYKMCRNFMVYFYLPFVSFGLSLYVIQNIQIAFDWNNAEWWQIFLIALLIMIFFSIVSGNKSQKTVFINNFLLVFKILPIIFIIIFGFYKIAIDDVNDLPIFSKENINDELEINSLKFTRPFVSLSPVTGIFASVPAIYFTFDGFYKVTTIQKDLKEPNKVSRILVAGVFLIAIIYIILTIFIMIGFQDGNAINVLLENKTAQKIIKIFMGSLIAISLLGCINANSIMGSKIFEAVINEGGLRIFSFMKINSKKVFTKGNIAFNIVGFTALFFIVFVGTFFFMNSSNYKFINDGVNWMYSFLDLLLGWTSLLIFIMILFPIFGYFKLKKESHKKYFIISIFASILILYGSIFTVIEVIGNLVIMCNNNYFYNIDSDFYNYNFLELGRKNAFDILNQNFLATILKLILLFFIIIVFGLNALVYYIKDRKKFRRKNEILMKKSNH